MVSFVEPVLVWMKRDISSDVIGHDEDSLATFLESLSEAGIGDLDFSDF